MGKFESIRDCMATDLITFSPDTDIMTAIDTILGKEISGAPVVDADGKLVGILSEKDCLRISMEGAYGTNPSGRGTVADFMSHDVKTISDDKDVVEAAHQFINSHFRRFPVVDSEGKLVGQISRRDILRAIKKINPKEVVVPASWVGREPGKYQKT